MLYQLPCYMPVCTKVTVHHHGGLKGGKDEYLSLYVRLPLNINSS